jgi:hypothetical protein
MIRIQNISSSPEVCPLSLGVVIGIGSHACYRKWWAVDRAHFAQQLSRSYGKVKRETTDVGADKGGGCLTVEDHLCNSHRYEDLVWARVSFHLASHDMFSSSKLLFLYSC